MKLCIKILFVCISILLIGCSHKSKIVVRLWGQPISAEELEATPGDKKILKMEIERLGESNLSIEELDKAKVINLKLYKTKKCYSFIKKKTLNYYMPQTNIHVDNKTLEYWIDKYVTSLGFSTAKLNEIQKNALFDLDVLRLYLTDKNKAKYKLNESSFSEIEGVWKGIEERAKKETLETLQEKIALINKKGVAWYLFSNQVEYICQVEILVDSIEKTDIPSASLKSYQSINWKEYQNKQLARFNNYLIKEIENGENVIFYDNKLKIDVLKYIVNSFIIE